MGTVTSPWWPRRRVEPTDPMGYESALMPGSFEPIETLGDTGPVPLDDGGAALEQLRREDRMFVRCLAVLAVVAFVLFGSGRLG